MKKYLEASKYIDWQHADIRHKAKELGRHCGDNTQVAKRCFEFVRDEIKHSWDYQRHPVTAKASDVLGYKTGYCYAKSHLLAALLRANDMPAGLCYQRLTIGEGSPYFCLHGLNAIYLDCCGWYRVDARGNKPGVVADFSPPVEQLAFSTDIPGECDFPEIWSKPLSVVIDVLEAGENYVDIANNLPDVDIIKRMK